MNRAGANPLLGTTPQIGAWPHRAYLMRTSVITSDIRARQRFYSVAQQVALHARPGDAILIDRIVEAVEAGAMTYRDAHACLARLRRQQQASELATRDHDHAKRLPCHPNCPGWQP